MTIYKVRTPLISLPFTTHTHIHNIHNHLENLAIF